MGRLIPRVVAAAVLLAGATAAAGCELSIGNLAGRATDETTKTYTLAAGGELAIDNTNGRIEIEATDGPAIEVRTERIAKATSDAAARDILAKIEQKEEVSPSRVALSTSKPAGLLIGVSVEVRYHVKAPKRTAVDLSVTNGQVVVTGLDGRMKVSTTNGAVTARGVGGAVEAESTNGRVSVALASVGTGPIALSTTNGRVRLELPATAKADIDASCVNGRIDAVGLKLDASEQSKRRLVGKLNGGGTPITLHTTNGAISIRPAGAAESRASDDER